jgi:hypothetical protein
MSQRLTPSILIDNTHEKMVKFESSLDEGYTKIKENLDDMVRSARESALKEKAKVMS